LGFLVPWPFGRKNPYSPLLDFLGFPWILSSESRLINGLHGIFADRILLALFPLRLRRGTRAHSLGHAGAQDCSLGKLNLISDYQQELVALPD
jgi:hypothetical protein